MNTTPFPISKKHSLPEQLLVFLCATKEAMRSGRYLFFTAKPENVTPQHMPLASMYLTRIIIDAYLTNRSVDDMRGVLAYHHEEFTRALSVFDSEDMRNNMASTVNDAFRALAWVVSNGTQPEQLYQAYRYDMSFSDAHTIEASLLALHSGFLLFFGSQENNDYSLPLDAERDMAALWWSWDKQCVSVGLQYITPHMHPNNNASDIFGASTLSREERSTTRFMKINLALFAKLSNQHRMTHKQPNTSDLTSFVFREGLEAYTSSMTSKDSAVRYLEDAEYPAIFTERQLA